MLLAKAATLTALAVVAAPPHLVFGDRPCVGLLVDDVAATRSRMEAAGVDFLWDTQHDEHRSWAHFRGPDGTVAELIGPRS